MKIPFVQFILITLSLPLLLSCSKNAKVVSEISLERWTVTGDSEEYAKGQIQFLETKQFNEEGIQSGHLFYSPDKQLTAKEIRIFEDGQKGPTGSQYKDTKDSILSYYTFETQDNGLISKSNAFDAKNNEPLRIEEYKYNSRGHLIEKITKNAQGEAVRIFKYTLDQEGNEQQVQVLNPNGTEILTEIFKITKYDGQKRWTEKWGFVHNKPYSFLARRIKYHKRS